MRILTTDDLWIGAGAILAWAIVRAFCTHNGLLWCSLWERAVHEWMDRVLSLRASATDLEWVFRAVRWTAALSRRWSRLNDPPSSDGRPSVKDTSSHHHSAHSYLPHWLRDCFSLCLWVSRRSFPLPSSGSTSKRAANPPTRPVSVVAVAGFAFFSVSAVISSLRYQASHLRI